MLKTGHQSASAGGYFPMTQDSIRGGQPCSFCILEAPLNEIILGFWLSTIRKRHTQDIQSSVRSALTVRPGKVMSSAQSAGVSGSLIPTPSSPLHTKHTGLLTRTGTLTEHHLLAGLELWHLQLLPLPSFFSLEWLEAGKVFPKRTEKVICHILISLLRNH